MATHDSPPPTLTLEPEPDESPDALRDRYIKVLREHARHVSAQSVSLMGMIHDLGKRLDTHIAIEYAWQSAAMIELKANSASTEIVREWAERRTWWRGFRERLKGLRGWVIGIATTIAAIAGAWIAVVQLWGKGPPSGGIGPTP